MSLTPSRVASNERQSLCPWPPRPCEPDGAAVDHDVVALAGEDVHAAVGKRRGCARRQRRVCDLAEQPPCLRRGAAETDERRHVRVVVHVLSAERQRPRVVGVAPERRAPARVEDRGRKARHRDETRSIRLGHGRAELLAVQRG